MMTIQELAEEVGVSAHTLRYYEREGLMPEVRRDAGSGHRRYDDVHVRWVRFLRRLRLAGMPIAMVRRYVDAVRSGDSGNDERLALLAAHRSEVVRRLDELGAHLEVLDRKLERGCGPEPAQGQTHTESPTNEETHEQSKQTRRRSGPRSVLPGARNR